MDTQIEESDVSYVDGTQVINLDNSIESSPEAVRTAVSFANAEFLKSMAEHIRNIAELVEVAEGWRCELREPPFNKYSGDTYPQIEVWLEDAKTFRTNVLALQEDAQGLEYDIIESNCNYGHQQIARDWQDLKDTVDFLVGRASAQTRKLKREGSDVPADNHAEKRARSSTD